MILYIGALALGCVALYFGGEWLIRGMKGLGRTLGLSPAAVGLLLVSFGTSAPELFVSAGAAVQGYGDIAAGNAVGSNIVNLAVVLGLGALIATLPVSRAIVRRQLPLTCAMTLLAVLLLLDGTATRLDGALLLGLCAAGLFWAVRARASSDGEEAAAEALADDAVVGEGAVAGADMPVGKRTSALYALGGLVLLALGAEGLIWGGHGVAVALGVPDAVIALTVTSVGTSLPEIAATIIAVSRREVDLAIGNVAGSNVMNLGLVLGLSAVLTPIDGSGLDGLTWGTLLALTALVTALGWWRGRIARAVGGLLLAAYAAYVTLLLV